MESAAVNDYPEQVKKYLPPWKSDEILKEIRSHILDQAEGLAAERGVTVDEALLREVTSKLGDPAKLAAGYVPPVTLIRPEYTTPFLLYAGIAVAISLLIGIFAGPAIWIGNALLWIGILFVFFVALSRRSKIYQLPLWHPALEKMGVSVGQEGLFGIRLGNVSSQKSAPSFGGTATAAPPAEPVAPPEPKLSFWERRIQNSGPRPLNWAEMFGASVKTVLGLALMAYFAFAPTPLPFFSFQFEDPRWGWHLTTTVPGFDPFRELAAVAALMTMLSGLIAIFLGRTRISLGVAVLSKLAWAILIVALMTGGPLFSIDFESVHPSVQGDWPLVRSAIQSAVPIALFVLLVLHLLSMAGKIYRFGMMQAWYQMEEKQ